MADAMLSIKRSDLDKIRKAIDSGQFPVMEIDGFGSIMFAKDQETRTLRLGFAGKKTPTEDELDVLRDLVDQFSRLLYPDAYLGRREICGIGAIDLRTDHGKKIFRDMLRFDGEFPGSFRGKEG